MTNMSGERQKLMRWVCSLNVLAHPLDRANLQCDSQLAPRSTRETEAKESAPCQIAIGPGLSCS
jgi:hypothetical protein